MKTQRLAIALTGVNLVLLLYVISQAGSAAPQSIAPILRGNALELVDDHGQIRARLNVQSDGEVILRLLDEKGTIRVKLGASADGAGLVLLHDATEPGVQILAKTVGSSVKLKNKDGRERVIAP
jgi:hypothetical protein